MWALHYTHWDAELRKGRVWHTDIGINADKSTGECILYVRIAFERSRYDLVLDAPAPRPSPPKFVRWLCAKESTFKTYSNRDEFGLYEVPLPVGVDHVKAMGKWLIGKDRIYPMIVFNVTLDRDNQREMKRFAQALAGKAQVLYLDQSEGVAEKLRNELPHDIRIPRGTFRVFFPIPDFSRFRDRRHRWFHFDGTIEYYKERSKLIHSLLSVYNMKEVGCVRSTSEVGRHLAIDKLKKKAESGATSSAELKGFYGLLEEVENERDEYKGMAQLFETESDEQKQELHRLKEQIKAYEGSGIGMNGSSNARSHIPTLPTDLVEVVGLISKLYEDRLYFCEEAFDSAKKYNSKFQSIYNAWELLSLVGTTLFEMKFGDNPITDIEGEFTRSCRYEYAKTEGGLSKDNKSICRTRERVVEGEIFEIWPHVGYGNSQPNLLRIHFAFDDAKRRIIIGHVGDHMPNASSRNRK